MVVKKNTKQNNQKEKISSLIEDLQLLESYTQELFAFFPLPLCFVSPNGVILEANPAFEKISGYKIHSIIGKSIEEFAEEQKIRKIAQETLKKGFLQGREIIFFPKNRKKLVVDIFSQVRRTEKKEITGYFIAIFDLTSIKKSEQELKEAQSALLNILGDTEEARRLAEEEKNKTRATLTSFIDGLIVFDREKKITLVNPQAEKILGLKEEQVLYKKIDQISGFPNLSQLYQTFGQKLEWTGQKYALVLEKPLKRFFQVKITPVAVEGETTGLMIILHDITREKEIDRMKSEFVSIAAHQLRTPLSAIKWTLRTLLDGDFGKITDEQVEFLDKAYQINERMIALINDLLDLARIEEGRFVYNFTPQSLEELIEKIISRFDKQIKAKGLNLVFKKPGKSLPKIKVDPEKIELVIQNLLDNAIRYTLTEGKVTISVKRDKLNLEISIQDNGIGIPIQQQDRVFTKFFRGDNVLQKETEGTGLGLFICKNIIEAHEGKIWFKSAENKGTTFFFTLPVEERFGEFLKKF